jgi:hypothetical protein
MEGNLLGDVPDLLSSLALALDDLAELRRLLTTVVDEFECDMEAYNRRLLEACKAALGQTEPHEESVAGYRKEADHADD